VILLGVLRTISLVFTSRLYVRGDDLLQTSFFLPAFAQGCLSLQITVFAEPAAHENLLPFPGRILAIKLIRVHPYCDEAFSLFHYLGLTPFLHSQKKIN
jgi:hypothetical protein